MTWHVDQRKVVDYLLSATSVPGAAKNRFFRSLGFAPADWETFRDALADHPLTATLASVDNTSPYGDKRVYHCQITSPNGRDPCIRTVWQQSDDTYRLLTAYPFL